MSKEDVKDIVPEILSNIKKEFDSGIKSNENISKALEILSQNKADFATANELSIEVGQVLSDVYKNNISASILPDGRMYFNIADRLITKPMEKAHSFIADYAENVQANLNAEANLGIRAIRPELNRDRIKGLVEKASNAENFEEVAWLLDEPIKNFCQSIIDDTIRANAEFQHRAGLQPVIKRKIAGNCCDWCKQLEGTYDYPDVPDEVYKRHRYCRCTVDYHPADGKKAQNVHTKKWKDVDKKEKVEQRKELAYQGARGNGIQNIAMAKAMELGYNPLPQDKVVEVLRKDAKEWLEKLTDEEKRAIAKYTDNGIDKNGKKLFEKINGYFLGRYAPVDEVEKNTIIRNYINIKNGILQSRLNHDIIVYRKDISPNNLNGTVSKFISTSVTQKGVLGGKPNVAIIVPKGSNGAYIEDLAGTKYKHQREFLLNFNSRLRLIENHNDLFYYIVEESEDEG